MRHILSVLLLLVALTTQGQRAYHIKHFGETDELRVRGEVSIAQVNGFIFVGTSEGLRAFDGKHASLYRVPDNDRAGGFYGMITGVVQSADGVIWAGTHRGFYTFDIEHERLVPYRVEGLPENPSVSHMKFDAYNRLWVVVNGKPYRIDPERRRAYCIDENLSRVRYLMLSREGTVWMGDVEGLLYRYDEPNNRVRAYTVKPEGAKEFRRIAAITEMQDGSLAVTSETDGVCLFSVKDFSSRLLFDKDEGKPLLAHTAITPDGTNLWVGTERGIVICNVKTGALSALRQSDTAFHTLTDNAVYTLFLDQEMGVWAGTYFGGLHRISLLPSNFTISLPEVEGVDVVREMVQDSQGRIWVGTEDGGLYEFDEETLRLRPVKVDWGSEPEPYNVQSLLLVDDELWLSTATSGIYMLNLEKMRLRQRHVDKPHVAGRAAEPHQHVPPEWRHLRVHVQRRVPVLSQDERLPSPARSLGHVCAPPAGRPRQHGVDVHLQQWLVEDVEEEREVGAPQDTLRVSMRDVLLPGLARCVLGGQRPSRPDGL